MTDVRFSLFDSLDHFPSDLIRQLWLMQQINTRLDQQYSQRKSDNVKQHSTIYHRAQLRRQVKLIRALVTQQNERLNLQKAQLQLQKQLRHESLLKGILPPVQAPLQHDRPQQHHVTDIHTLHGEQQHLKLTQSGRQSELLTQNKTETNNEGSNDQDTNKYCFCNKDSFGDMIACDYDKCPREWFHYKCVSIDPANPPKGVWFCSRECRLLDKRDKMRLRRLNEKLMKERRSKNYRLKKT